MLTPTMPPATMTMLSSLAALAEVDVVALSGHEQAELLRVLARVEAKVCAIKLRLLAAAEDAGTSPGRWSGEHGAVGGEGDQLRPRCGAPRGRSCGGLG